MADHGKFDVIHAEENYYL